MNKFNHLYPPSRWEKYFTESPEGYTILEALFNWLHQVNEMVDNQNDLNNRVDQFRSELDDFIEQFEPNLQEKVTTILGEWQESGFLDIVIDSALETKFHEMDDRLTSQLAEVETQLEGLEVNVTTVGIYPNTDVDYSQQLQELINTGVDIVLPQGRYIINDELHFKHGQGIRTVGKVTFDGTNFVGTSGESIINVGSDGNAYIELPQLSNDINVGDRQITFNTNHNLKQGDIICLYDNTDFSWSSSRYYYRKSEFALVSSIISDTTILLDSEVFDSYPINANFGAYKMNMGTFSIEGELEIIQGKTDNTYGIRLNRIKNGNYKNVTVYAHSSYAGVSLEQCYNVSIEATAINKDISGNNTDYGLAIVNSQHIRASGYFVAPRHGVTITSKTGVGAIVCRDIQIEGTIKTENTGSVGGSTALNAHGNTQYYSFHGVVYGGVSLGGSDSDIKGLVFGNKYGICVYFSELSSFEHDLSSLTCKTIHNADDESRGVVDLGGNSTSEDNNAKGGLLNFKNMVVHAPNSRRGIVVRTRNTTIDSNSFIDVDVNGLHVELSNSLANVLPVQVENSTGTKGFRNVLIEKITYNNGNIRVVGDIENMELMKKRGSTDYTTSTSSNFHTVQIVFDSPYPSNYTPIVNVNLNVGQLDGVELVGKLINTTYNGFNYRVLTLDGSNFGSEVTNTINWSAH